MKAEIETTTGVMLSVEEYNRLSASDKRVKELEAVVHGQKVELQKYRKRIGDMKQDARELPLELFDGLAVYKAISPKGLICTSAENVSYVLDAVVKLIRDRKALEAPHEP